MHAQAMSDTGHRRSLRPATRWLRRLAGLVAGAALATVPQMALAHDFDLAAATAEPVAASAPAADTVTLFQNVRVFDGRSPTLSAPSNVLVRGNRIERISAAPIEIPSGDDAVVIAGDGRVLMPGLIDAHWHAFMAATPQVVLMTAEPQYLHMLAARQAEATLMRGFTTIRDLGGPVTGLKRAIDEGVMIGPRIYPSGAFISQTSGHGDFRTRSELPRQPGGPLSVSEREGIAAIADSPDEVRLRVREQLRLGASQIKLMASGGVSSPPHNPLASLQFTDAELRAAVEAAADWGTYVTVHAYTPKAIQRAVAAGVQCIDHGQLMDEETAKLLAEKGVWLSLQPLLDEDDIPALSPDSMERAHQVFAGTDNAYRLARKYGIKTAFGSDALFDERIASQQGRQLVKLQKWYTPAEALTMATADNAELMAMSGFINPYPGKLGVVEEGALADLLLVDGDPLQDLALIEDPETNLVVIMKDGLIYKDTLPQ
jgi:imidazolonepropionase-like amidohydrolase